MVFNLNALTATPDNNIPLAINGITYEQLDKLTSQNANPANIPAKFTNDIDQLKLWNNGFFDNYVHGIAHVFGMDVAQHLNVDNASFVNEPFKEGGELRYKKEVMEAQLLAWTKLVLCQKSKGGDIFMPLPIIVGTEYVTVSAYLDLNCLSIPSNIAGLDIIEQVGIKVSLPDAYNTIQNAVSEIAKYLEVDDNIGAIYKKLKQMSKKSNWTVKCLVTGLMTHFLSESFPQYTFLVDSHVYAFLKTVTKHVCENIVSVDSNWNRFLEFKVEPKHVSWYINEWCTKINKMYKGDGKQSFIKLETYRLPSGENELHIIFEGLHKLIVNNEGVFEDDRNRQLYNNAVVNQQAIEYTNGDIQKEDITYLNSYGVLLQYLVTNAAVFAETAPRLSQFFSKRLLNDLTFVAVKDMGEVDGDRRMLEKSTTTTTTSTDYVSVWSTKAANGEWNPPQHKIYSTIPFSFKKGIADCQINVTRHYRKLRQEYVALYRVDKVAFIELNLARAKKHLIDGRRVALQAKHIPNTVRETVLKIICLQAYDIKSFNFEAMKDLYNVSFNETEIMLLEQAIYKDFPDLIAAQYSSEELWQYLGQELVFGLSSKLSKLVKRTIMYAAQIGNLLESEEIHLKQRGQKDSSVNNQAVKCIVSAFHCDAQGVANTFEHEGQGYLFNHLVPHRIDRKLSLRPIPLAANQPDTVTLDLETYLGKPTVEGVNGLWKVYKFEPGIPKNFQEQILAMPFQPLGSASKTGTIDFNLFNEYDDALITEVRVRYAPMAGKIKLVQIQVDCTTLEHNVKGRGITKTMFTNVDASVVFNNLNPKLDTKAVDAIFYKDTNKWLDTTFNLLPMIYMTAYKNADTWVEGMNIITEINKIAGDNNWSALLDRMGVYTPLRAAFDLKFGKQALWVQHEEKGCDVEQSCIGLEYNMYKNAKGWNLLTSLPNEIMNAIPEQYVDVQAYIQGDVNEYENNKINIKIFGCDETKTNWYTAQRSRVYVGSADCPLYMPVKAEMASVRSSIGTSPAMGGVIRNIATYDREFAVKMLAANFKNYNKFAGFLGMARSSSIQPTQGEEFKTVVMNPNGRLSQEATNLLRTDKVREMYKACENTGTFLLELSKLFNNINFVILTDNIVKENADDKEEVGVREQASFSLYLPIIVNQSAGAGFRTVDDLSSNIQKLFVNLLHGSNWVQMGEDGIEYDNTLTVNLCNRIGGAIKSLSKTKGIAKCGSFGISGVMSKPTGLYGVPLDEVWVRKSERYDSVYKTMLRTYKLKPSQLDMHPVLFSRSPMTATAKVRVRVIDQWHDMFNYVNEDGFTFNPLACYYHRGDYDGDLNYLYSGILDGIECKVPYLTVSGLVESIKASTGNDQLHPGGSYYGDGFDVPTFASVAKKRSFTSDSLTINSVESNMLDPNTKTKASMGQLLSGSTQMLLQAVGIAHRLFITTDLYVTAIEELKVLLGNEAPPEFKVMNWLDVKIIQILAEIYEVPLGGFDKWAYIVFYEHIIPLINGDKEATFAVDLIASGLTAPTGEVIADLNTLSGIMKKAGMNGSIIVHKEADGQFEKGQVESVADDVNKAIEALTMCKSWKKNMKQIDGKEFSNWGDNKYQQFFSLVAEISLLLSKGAFLPEVTKSGAANYVDDSSDNYSPEELAAMGFEVFYDEEEEDDDTIDEQKNVSLQRKMLNAYVKGASALGIDPEVAIATSTVFGPIEYYRKTVCNALIGDTVLIDTSFFNKTVKEIVNVQTVEVTSIEVEESNVDDDSLFNAFDDFVNSIEA